MPCDNEGRYWGYVSTHQGTTEVRRETWNTFPSLQKKRNLLTPRSQTFSLQNLATLNANKCTHPQHSSCLGRKEASHKQLLKLLLHLELKF
jgi:hypothetical protein